MKTSITACMNHLLLLILACGIGEEVCGSEDDWRNNTCNASTYINVISALKGNSFVLMLSVFSSLTIFSLYKEICLTFFGILSLLVFHNKS